MSKAVVLGLYGLNSLGVTRSLGLEGIVVNGYHFGNKFPSTLYSSFLNKGFVCEDERQFLTFLLRENDEKKVLFPTGDDMLFFCDRYSEELMKLNYVVPNSKMGRICDLLDKNRNLEIGKKAGFRVPQSQYLTDLLSISGKILVKPLNSDGTGKQDIYIFDSLKDLNRKKDDLIGRYGNMVVQEYICGDVEDHYEIHCYNSSNGPVFGSMIQKLRALENTTKGSIGSVIRSVWIPELADSSNNLMRNLGYNGLLDINLLKDKYSGEYYFLEVNLRSSANIMIDTISGNNLASIMYFDNLGEDYSHLLRSNQINKFWVAEHRIDFNDEIDRHYLENADSLGYYFPGDEKPIQMLKSTGNFVSELKHNN